MATRAQPHAIAIARHTGLSTEWRMVTTHPRDSTAELRRVDDLIAGMTLEQKVAQLQCTILLDGNLEAGLAEFPYGVGALGTISTGQSVVTDADRYDELQDVIRAKTGIGIPPLLHGEAVSGWTGHDGTIFPSAIGLGATWKPETIRSISSMARDQMLAVGVRQALSPVMDVARDPRWGRVGETYGEDPTLCAAMSVSFVKGLQGPQLKEGVAATAKHFLGFGFSAGGLNMASNPIPRRELREVYAKPFQAAITEAGLAAVMNSYGSIDGELIVTSPQILHDLLRVEMGFEGPVVSDYMSVKLAVELNVASDSATAGLQALDAGLDVELPTPYGYGQSMIDAVRQGQIDELIIDRSLRRWLALKNQLGLLDEHRAVRELIPHCYSAESTAALGLTAARESIVLLKNEGVLPLVRRQQKIAVIGPHADSLRLFFSCYTKPASIELTVGGTMSELAGMLDVPGIAGKDAPKSPLFEGSNVRTEAPQVEDALREIYGHKTKSILDAIESKCPSADVSYHKGCAIAGTDRSGFDAAFTAALEADVVIVAVGGKYGWGSSCTTGEGIDCADVGLPGVQEELATLIASTGTPAVLVHMDTKPLSSETISARYAAILEYWFPGEAGGEPLADVLFGDYNPAGRLPITAVRHSGQIPLYAAHRRSDADSSSDTMILNRYVDTMTSPLFVFGEGRSYTTFAYSNLNLTEIVPADGQVHLSCDVTNTGDRDGDEVVQVYVRDELASMVRPTQELAGFKRVHIAAGDSKTIQFSMRADQFAFLDVEMRWVVEAGDMTVRVGSSSTDIRLTGTFTIQNTKFIDGKTRGFFAHSAVAQP
ncbi:glycoside hydrolase family 3 C-terminal domain-containing protein [Mycobacterium sp. OAE908]|uniref:glycoside hydrolase family 3 N-terminal domain-containing protein n=1 Tax=Mycobacterium sp. OAE908 TaxID=2817899 RepID=UPI001AEA0D42